MKIQNTVFLITTTLLTLGLHAQGIQCVKHCETSKIEYEQCIKEKCSYTGKLSGLKFYCSKKNKLFSFKILKQLPASPITFGAEKYEVLGYLPHYKKSMRQKFSSIINVKTMPYDEYEQGLNLWGGLEKAKSLYGIKWVQGYLGRPGNLYIKAYYQNYVSGKALSFNCKVTR